MTDPTTGNIVAMTTVDEGAVAKIGAIVLLNLAVFGGATNAHLVETITAEIMIVDTRQIAVVLLGAVVFGGATKVCQKLMVIQKTKIAGALMVHSALNAVAMITHTMGAVVIFHTTSAGAVIHCATSAGAESQNFRLSQR